jgi:hypothetical protein
VCMSYSSHRPFPHQTNPRSRRNWQCSFKMAGNQRQDLEVGFDGVRNLSGRSLWWAVADTLFISVPNQTEPQPVIS